MRNLLVICMLIFTALAGCARSSLTAEVVPNVDLSKIETIYVEKFAPDKHNLHQVIADQLTLMGYLATAGEADQAPKGVETIITYKDAWMWDIRMYLKEITIELRQVSGRRLLAAGKSKRNSIARVMPDEMIRETLEKILR